LVATGGQERNLSRSGVSAIRLGSLTLRPRRWAGPSGICPNSSDWSGLRPA